MKHFSIEIFNFITKKILIKFANEANIHYTFGKNIYIISPKIYFSTKHDMIRMTYQNLHDDQK